MSYGPTTMRRRSSIKAAFLSLAGILAAVGPADAQEVAGDRPGWQRNFEDVEVKTIRPDDLPDADESALPAALTKKSALPRATSLEVLRKTSADMGPLVLEVLVVPRSDSPIRQSSVIVRGEASWLSANADRTAPVLVTNAHYVMNAEKVFVRPREAKTSEGELPRARRETVSTMSLGSDVKALLKDPSLIEVTVVASDKHRNLAVLQSDDSRFQAPAKGLGLFPIDDEAASSLYGFSHQMGSTLVVTMFLAPKEKRDELSFYLHTTYPVILGAPLVDAQGRVLAITAMRHPTEPERTLVIPPRALQRYLEGLQKSDDAPPK